MSNLNNIIVDDKNIVLDGDNFPKDFYMKLLPIAEFKIVKNNTVGKDLYDVYKNGKWFALLSLENVYNPPLFKCYIDEENTILDVAVNSFDITLENSFVTDSIRKSYFYFIFLKIFDFIMNKQKYNSDSIDTTNSDNSITQIAEIAIDHPEYLTHNEIKELAKTFLTFTRN